MSLEKMNSETRFIIKGPVQSGKTKTLLSHVQMSIVSGIKTVVMTRCVTYDAKQMLEDCEKLMNKDGKGIKSVSIQGVNSWVKTNNEINNLVILGNYSQVQKLLKAIEQFGKPLRFNLFIDEADLLLSSQESKGVQNHFKFNMEKLVPMANTVFAVSATTQQLYYMPGFASCGNIIKVNYDHKLYKGFDYLNHRSIPKTEKAEKLLDRHHGLPAVVAEWDRDTSYKQRFNHPLIALVKLTHRKQQHKELLEYVKNNTKHKWALIIYNGDGIEMQHDDLDTFAIEESFNINGDDGKRKSKNTYVFKKANVQEALVLLRKYEDKMNITHIGIFAGKLAGRAVRFSCSDYKWHITDEYLAENKYTTLETTVQSLRILGCFNDNNLLTLWCDDDTYKDIKTYYQLDHDITKSITNSPDKKVSTSEHIKNLKIKKSRIPNRRICENQRGALSVIVDD